jgi:hypothetical protein
MAIQDGLNDLGYARETQRPGKECRHRHFIRRIQDRGTRAAGLGRLSGEPERREPPDIRGLEVETRSRHEVERFYT